MASIFSQLAGYFRREPIKPTQTQGVSGTPIYGGFVNSPETNPELVGTQRYRRFGETMVNVSIVGASVRAFLNLIAKSTWTLEAKDGREAQDFSDFCESCMHDMGTPWFRVVRKAALYRFYGFSIQEWQAKKRKDGMIGYADVFARPQYTIEQWDMGETGGDTLIGVIQRGPTDGETYYLPRKKLIYCLDDSLSDSPEGVGLIRHVMDDVKALVRYLQLEGWGFETDLKGMPVIRAPLTRLNQEVKAGRMSPEERTAALKGVRSFLTNHLKTPNLGLLLDSLTYQDKIDGNPSSIYQFDASLLTADSSQTHDAVGAAVDRLTRSIARPLGCEWLLMGDGSGGSYAQHADKTAMFSTLCSGSLTELAWFFRQDFLLPLARMNGVDEELVPDLKPDPVQLRDVTQITKSLLDLSQAGASILPNDPVVNQVRGMMNLVEVPQEQMDAQAELALMPPPQPGAGPNGDSKGAPPDDAEDAKPVSEATAKRIAKASTTKGVMIALFLPEEVARQVSLTGGADTTALHVTLAHLGKNLSDDQVQLVSYAARRIAAKAAPLELTLGGMGRFFMPENPSGDPVYLSVDCPALAGMRDALQWELTRLGVPYSTDHGFTPHVTLCYVPHEAPTPGLACCEPISFTADALVVASGVERVAIPLTGGA